MTIDTYKHNTGVKPQRVEAWEQSADLPKCVKLSKIFNLNGGRFACDQMKC
jgi:hypothetical protein